MSDPVLLFMERIERKLERADEQRGEMQKDISFIREDVVVLKASVPPLAGDVDKMKEHIGDLQQSRAKIRGAIAVVGAAGGTGLIAGLWAWIQQMFRGH